MILTSIDPGKHHAGVAVWRDGVLERAYLAGGDVKASWLDFLRELPATTDQGIIEIPQIYPGKPVRHEDLIQLAASAGAIAGYIKGAWVAARPAVWTRATTQDKDIRLQQTWERLSPAEQARCEMPSTKLRKADVLDAIALGMYFLRRW